MARPVSISSVRIAGGARHTIAKSSPRYARNGLIDVAAQQKPFTATQEVGAIVGHRSANAEHIDYAPTMTPATTYMGDFTRLTQGDRSSLHLLSNLSSGPRAIQARALHHSAPSHLRASAPLSVAPSARRTKEKTRDPDEIAIRYYVERKAERELVEERKDADGDLMPALAAGIVAEGLAASITPREGKVPTEFVTDEGVAVHASGFVPPTPAEFHAETGVIPDGVTAVLIEPDTTLQDLTTPPSLADIPRARAAHEAKPAGATPHVPPPAHAESTTAAYKRGLHTAPRRARSPPRRVRAPVAAFHTTPSRWATRDDDAIALRYYAERRDTAGELMPTLAASIAADGFTAAIVPDERKVPRDVLGADGTLQHASGFIPPTPAGVHEQLGVIADGLQAHA